MAKKSGREFEDVAADYLRAWDSHGFDVRFCDVPPCTGGEPLDIASAVEAAVRRGESNLFFSRRPPP